MGVKYYAGVEKAQEQDRRADNGKLEPFDFDKLARPGLAAKVVGWGQRKAIDLLLPFSRRFMPVLKVGGFYWITRREDVLAALEAPDVLEVPYGREMKELSRSADGTEADFVLGIDGPGQARQNQIIRDVMLPGDRKRLEDWATAFSESLLDGGRGELDLIGDFILRVPTEICRRYFGLEFSDPDRFAEWAMAVSGLLFADPTGDPVKRRLAKAGAARLCRIIDVSIARAEAGCARKAGPLPPLDDMTIVERLVTVMRCCPQRGLTGTEIRAIVLGLVVGFIPTNGLAAANMVEGMLSGPEFAAARVAAWAGDDEAMREVVLEAGRRRPALAPGQWRYTRTPYTVGKGRWYQRTIPAGETVMVSTQSALRDSRPAPPNSRDRYELIFGHGDHACLGEKSAIAIITRMFLSLHARPNLEPKAWFGTGIKRAGFFPRRLDVWYGAKSATQTQIVCGIPVTANLPAAQLEAAVRALGNPAEPHVVEALDATGIVHFASASLISSGDTDTGPLHLLLEFNVDGERDAAIETIAACGESWLEPLVRKVSPGDPDTLGDILKRSVIKLTPSPWGATGLNFFGMRDVTVADIDKQHRLREAVLRKLDAYMRGAQGLSGRASASLSAVRRGLQRDPALAELDAFTVQPRRRKNLMSAWVKPKSYLSLLPKVLTLRRLAILVVLFGGAWAASVAMMKPASGAWGDWLTATVAGFVLAVIFWAVVLGAAYLFFRWAEAREKPDDRPADPARLREIVARENAPGFLQNHIIAVTPLKRTFTRRLALAVGLFLIDVMLVAFRPGFVVTMGTIHFAKWFRFPGSQKLIFQSNYDGSWESYLEDFITRAHPGQTAAWSNGEGFPKSKGLISEGARDGDRFKRWVRRQQIPTAFWYARFPRVTAKEKRANRMLHEGLAYARSDSDAREWLDLLGSAQRQPYELETGEIQSLVFRGMKRALFTACLPIALPPTAQERADWLVRVTERLTFGQFPRGNRAAYLAFSAAGLKRYNDDAAKGGWPIDLAKEFPPAFREGMARRGSILGDAPPDDANEAWLWKDASAQDEPADGEAVTDAVIMIYAQSREGLERRIAYHQGLLGRFNGRLTYEPIRTVSLDSDRLINTDPKKASESYEHFGFRDGISTPVIRGNEQFTPQASIRDVVEPGEFILGYQNNQGYVAPSMLTPAYSDPLATLPLAPGALSFGFADFAPSGEGQGEARDFSRNGTFLAIRQLRQDRDGFDAFTEDRAQALRRDYAGLDKVVGDQISAHWVGAKLMGRWKDGRPLIGNPTAKRQVPMGDPANDFAFGRDDPRGQACPLGAHIRRTNPRDSLEPNDPLEQMITRRHALIRRGRSYIYDKAAGDYVTQATEGEVETGMLFVALCADLERQFEMVQQSWAGFPSFHGLANEPDPITTRSRAEPCPASRAYTIPTAAGPVVLRNMQSFVDMRGGGYFFLPSRSALRYLACLAGADARRVILDSMGDAIQGPPSMDLAAE